MANPTGKGGFQKGQSGNPNGRAPAGQSTAELLRLAGDLPYRAGEDQTRRQRAVEAIWAKACAGDLASFSLILERTEGKVPDVLNQNLNATHSHSVSAETIQAVLSAYARRHA